MNNKMDKIKCFTNLNDVCTSLKSDTFFEDFFCVALPYNRKLLCFFYNESIGILDNDDYYNALKIDECLLYNPVFDKFYDYKNNKFYNGIFEEGKKVLKYIDVYQAEMYFFQQININKCLAIDHLYQEIFSAMCIKPTVCVLYKYNADGLIAQKTENNFVTLIKYIVSIKPIHDKIVKKYNDYSAVLFDDNNASYIMNCVHMLEDGYKCLYKFHDPKEAFSLFNNILTHYNNGCYDMVDALLSCFFSVSDNVQHIYFMTNDLKIFQFRSEPYISSRLLLVFNKNTGIFMTKSYVKQDELNDDDFFRDCVNLHIEYEEFDYSPTPYYGFGNSVACISLPRIDYQNKCIKYCKFTFYLKRRISQSAFEIFFKKLEYVIYDIINTDNIINRYNNIYFFHSSRKCQLYDIFRQKIFSYIRKYNIEPDKNLLTRERMQYNSIECNEEGVKKLEQNNVVCNIIKHFGFSDITEMQRIFGMYMPKGCSSKWKIQGQLECNVRYDIYGSSYYDFYLYLFDNVCDVMNIFCIIEDLYNIKSPRAKMLIEILMRCFLYIGENCCRLAFYIKDNYYTFVNAQKDFLWLQDNYCIALSYGYSCKIQLDGSTKINIVKQEEYLKCKMTFDKSARSYPVQNNQVFILNNKQVISDNQVKIQNVQLDRGYNNNTQKSLYSTKNPIHFNDNTRWLIYGHTLTKNGMQIQYIYKFDSIDVVTDVLQTIYNLHYIGLSNRIYMINLFMRCFVRINDKLCFYIQEELYYLSNCFDFWDQYDIMELYENNIFSVRIGGVGHHNMPAIDQNDQLTIKYFSTQDNHIAQYSKLYIPYFDGHNENGELIIKYLVFEKGFNKLYLDYLDSFVFLLKNCSKMNLLSIIYEALLQSQQVIPKIRTLLIADINIKENSLIVHKNNKMLSYNGTLRKQMLIANDKINSIVYTGVWHDCHDIMKDIIKINQYFLIQCPNKLDNIVGYIDDCHILCLLDKDLSNAIISNNDIQDTYDPILDIFFDKNGQCIQSKHIYSITDDVNDNLYKYNWINMIRSNMNISDEVENYRLYKWIGVNNEIKFYSIKELLCIFRNSFCMQNTLKGSFVSIRKCLLIQQPKEEIQYIEKQVEFHEFLSLDHVIFALKNLSDFDNYKKFFFIDDNIAYVLNKNIYCFSMYDDNIFMLSCVKNKMIKYSAEAYFFYDNNNRFYQSNMKNANNEEWKRLYYNNVDNDIIFNATKVQFYSNPLSITAENIRSDFEKNNQVDNKMNLTLCVSIVVLICYTAVFFMIFPWGV